MIDLSPYSLAIFCHMRLLYWRKVFCTYLILVLPMKQERIARTEGSSSLDKKYQLVLSVLPFLYAKRLYKRPFQRTPCALRPQPKYVCVTTPADLRNILYLYYKNSSLKILRKICNSFPVFFSVFYYLSQPWPPIGCKEYSQQIGMCKRTPFQQQYTYK